MKSEKRFRLLFENAPLSYQSLDSETRIIDVNPAWLATLGYEREEVIGHFIKEFITPRSAELLKERFPVFVKQGEIRDYEFDMVRKDGTIISVTYQGNIGYDEFGVFKQTHCIFQDITERKQADQKLQESERFLNETQVIASLGTYTLDIGSGMWTSSEVLDNIFGIDASYHRTVEGWVSIIHPDWQKTMNDYFIKEVIGDHTPFDKEYKIIRKADNSERWVHGLGRLKFDNKGQPISMVGTIKDITERKQAEETLKESYELTRSLFSTVPFPVDIVDEKGTVLFMNAIMKKAVGGFRPDSTCWDIYKDDKKQCIHCPLKSPIKVGETKTIESEGVLGGNTFEVVHTGMMYKGTKAFMETFVDITVRKKRENKLNLAYDLLHKINSIVLVADSKGDIIFCSASTLKITGYSKDEVMGSKWWDVSYLSKAEAEASKALVLERMSTKGTGVLLPYKRPVKLKDGSVKWFEWHHTLRADRTIIAIGHDISAHIEAEREVLKLSQAVEQSPASVIITDPDGTINYVNPQFEKITGYTAEEAIGQNPRILKSGETTAEVYKELWATILSGNTWLGELHNKKKDGTMFWEKASIAPIMNEKGETTDFLAVKEDITEQKKIEKIETLTNEVLVLLNSDATMKEVLDKLIVKLREELQFSAIGIRLKENGDYPYYAHEGFSDGFIRAENNVVLKDRNKKVCKDEDGNPKLECTCGLVISGKVDAKHPLFTKAGSFCSNNTYPLLELKPEEEPRLNPRNRCIHLGYGSVAIIPIRNKKEIIGTLQLNHKAENAFDQVLIGYLEKLCLSIGNAIAKKLIEEEKEKIAERLKNTLEFMENSIEERTAELEKAKDELERINTDFISSLTYAKRIQDAIIPSEVEMKKAFSDAFCVYLPKDIISGDYYWLSANEEKVIFVLADCTGHGVPGALMSMAGHELLDSIIINRNIHRSDMVLEDMDKAMGNMLRRKDARLTMNDGMDMSVIHIDLEACVLSYSGAQSHGLFIRKGEVIALVPDRFGIGGNYTRKVKEFTRHRFEFGAGDRVYLFSDGYYDQFGGPNNKKILRKNLTRLLIDTAGLSMAEQRKRVLKHFNDWKGKGFQTDDVTVIGIEL